MGNQNILLWLDDTRNPFEGTWLNDYSPEYLDHETSDDLNVVWVKSFKEFKNWIETYGLPSTIGFDHDLGEDVARELVSSGVNKKKARLIKKESPSGYDAAKWLCDYCADNNKKIPKWFIQSANPTGRDNIENYLNNAKKHLNL